MKCSNKHSFLLGRTLFRVLPFIGILIILFFFSTASKPAIAASSGKASLSNHTASAKDLSSNHTTSTKTPSSNYIASIEAPSPSHTVSSLSSTVSTSSKTASKIKLWDSTSVYVPGDLVQYKKGIYRAKWWTQNELPSKTDEWGVWEYIGSVSSSETSQSSDKTPTSTNTSTNSSANTSTNTTTPSQSTKHPKQFKVVAYYPSWVTNGIDKLRFDTITHVNYSFAIPKEDGSLRPLENPALAKKIIKKAHANGAKALIIISRNL